MLSAMPCRRASAAMVTQSPAPFWFVNTFVPLICFNVLPWTDFYRAGDGGGTVPERSVASTAGQKRYQDLCQQSRFHLWEYLVYPYWTLYRRLPGRRPSLMHSLQLHPHPVPWNRDPCFPKSLVLKLINFLRREIKIFSTKNIFASKDTCHFSYLAI